MLALSWLEIKLKWKQCKGENSFIHIYYIYKQKIKEKKPSKLADEKKWVKEERRWIMIEKLSWEFDLYWKFICTYKKAMIRIKQTEPPSPFYSS